MFKIIHHPHDSLFKKAFQKKEIFIDFLKGRLKPELLSKIDLNSIQLTGSSFISSELKNSYSDLVFSANIQGEKGYLYLLLEHQTEADGKMVIRLLEYDVSLMRQHIELGHTKLPIIINLVLYTGNKPYPYPKRLIDAFENPKMFYDMLKRTFLIELRADKKDTIERDGKAALAELILRESHRRDLCNFLSANNDLVFHINKSPYSIETILYIIDRDPHDPEKVLEKLANLDPNKKQEIMSGLQRALQQREEQGMILGIRKGKAEGFLEGEEKGMEKGIEKGMEKGIENAVIGMQSAGVNIPLISKSTGLSIKEVDEILDASGK